MGIAFVVAVYLVYIAPSENRYWKRRMKLVEDRIRRKEEKEEQQQDSEEQV